MRNAGLADAQWATRTIGPHQNSVGLVNGKSTNATVVVAYHGAISSAQAGHPVGGKIAVEPPSTVAGTSGYTGSSGHSIVATFVQPAATVTSASTTTFYPTRVPVDSHFALAPPLSPRAGRK